MLGARKPAAESLARGTRAAGKGRVEARRPGPAGGHEDDFHAADLASRLIRKLRGGIRRRLTADASFPGGPRGHATSSRENLGRSSQRDEARVVEVDLGAIIPWVFHRQGRAIRDIRGASNAACIAAGVFEIVNPAAPTAEQRKKPAKVYHDFRRTAVRNLERGGLPLGSYEADRPQDGSCLPPLRDRRGGRSHRGREEAGHTPGSHGEACEVGGEKHGHGAPDRDGQRTGKVRGGRWLATPEDAMQTPRLIGAGRGNRTPTGLRPPDFEPADRVAAHGA
jgi:hypothetical protein